MIENMPTHPSQLTLSSVWIEARQKPMTATMATQPAVQRAWSEMALSEIESERRPEPASRAK